MSGLVGAKVAESKRARNIDEAKIHTLCYGQGGGGLPDLYAKGRTPPILATEYGVRLLVL